MPIPTYSTSSSNNVPRAATSPALISTTTQLRTVVDLSTPTTPRRSLQVSQLPLRFSWTNMFFNTRIFNNFYAAYGLPILTRRGLFLRHSWMVPNFDHFFDNGSWTATGCTTARGGICSALANKSWWSLMAFAHCLMAACCSGVRPPSTLQQNINYLGLRPKGLLGCSHEPALGNLLAGLEVALDPFLHWVLGNGDGNSRTKRYQCVHQQPVVLHIQSREDLRVGQTRFAQDQPSQIQVWKWRCSIRGM